MTSGGCVATPEITSIVMKDNFLYERQKDFNFTLLVEHFPFLINNSMASTQPCVDAAR